MQSKKECAASMGQRGNNAPLKDAQIIESKEEYVRDTGQSSNDATLKLVQIKHIKEECALGTGQRGNTVASRDAQIELRQEECALGTGQRSTDMNAAVMDVQTKSDVEECARDMEHIAMHKMNLLHLDQKRRLLQPTHVQISVVLDLHSEDQKEVVFLKR